MLASAEPSVRFRGLGDATNVEDLTGGGWIRETESDLESG